MYDDERGCLKCGSEETEVDEISTTKDGLSKYFDVQDDQFVAVSCTECGYSEFYRGQSPDDVVDVFLG